MKEIVLILTLNCLIYRNQFLRVLEVDDTFVIALLIIPMVVSMSAAPATRREPLHKVWMDAF